MISKHIVKCPHYPKEDYDIKKAVAEKPVFIVIIIQATSSFILLDIQINGYRNSLIISYLTFVNQKKSFKYFRKFQALKFQRKEDCDNALENRVHSPRQTHLEPQIRRNPV